ncbi:hypothetical protein KSX_72650 [Ktedonospora formicarum]|uniref:Uncharacterized protein n=2 Tax=Ktedonospora formicarum TaxID=2778364 RepID=A0A8J3IAL2_9CHLR|nr:hypothetical protein KSX_72650 [Ktedonospora formicarum]
MTIEGKLALPVENVRFTRNIADALIQLMRLSNFYALDLQQAWTDLLEEGYASLNNETIVAIMKATIRQNQERRALD